MIMDIADIAKMLNAKIDALVMELLPQAAREGHEWRIGSAAGERGRSMAIHRGGPKTGVWSDFSAGTGGDALDLIAAVNFGGDKKQALAWARRWLGIDRMSPDAMKTVRAEIAVKSRTDEEEARAEAIRKAKAARAIWHGAQHELSGSPVSFYLLGRGIGLGDLTRPPGALRYAPALDYPASMNDGVVTRWPAMVAAIINDLGVHIATHRTYLHSPMPGVVVKAPVKNSKLVLGSYRGGYIPLQRGASGVPLKDAPEGDTVILCEGIEDGLTLALACPEARVLACVSVTNFKNIILPRRVRDVVIAADNDAAGSPAAKALEEAVNGFLDQGKSVAVARAPDAKDFNALLTEGEAAKGVSL